MNPTILSKLRNGKPVVYTNIYTLKKICDITNLDSISLVLYFPSLIFNHAKIEENGISNNDIIENFVFFIFSILMLKKINNNLYIIQSLENISAQMATILLNMTQSFKAFNSNGKLNYQLFIHYLDHGESTQLEKEINTITDKIWHNIKSELITSFTFEIIFSKKYDISSLDLTIISEIVESWIVNHCLKIVTNSIGKIK